MWTKLVLDWMLTLLKHPASWIIAALLVIMTALLLQFKQVNDYRVYSGQLEDKVIATQVDLTKANGIIETYKKASETTQKAMGILEARNKKLKEELNRVSAELNSYRDRENVVLGKPAVVERRVNAATQRVFHELNCATGGTIDCNDGSPLANPTQHPSD